MRHKLAPDPRTAPNVRRVFDLALLEMTEGQIRKRLNLEGIPNASGGRWRSHRIHEALTNPHYAGTIVLTLNRSVVQSVYIDREALGNEPPASIRVVISAE